jgi:hypothetical protein
MDLKFGDIIYLSSYDKTRRKGAEEHFGVILYIDPTQTKTVVYQTMTSRMYKLFPSWGFLSKDGCMHCAVYPYKSEIERHKKCPYLYLDIDTAVILNYNKYSMLNKETFMCLKNYQTENFFLFQQAIKEGRYEYRGNLFDYNKRSVIDALKVSRAPLQFISQVIKFYKLTS